MPRHNPITTTMSATTTYNNYSLSSPRVTKIYHQPAQKPSIPENFNSKTVTTTRVIGSNAGPSSRPLVNPSSTKIYNNGNYRLIGKSIYYYTHEKFFRTLVALGVSGHF